MAPRRERTTTASFTVEETCDALRRWFRGLSPLERLQALAIQDAVWVKMYMVLAHKKPMQGMAEKEFEKELVKAIFHKLRKQSDDNHLLDSVLLSPSPSDASTETMELPSSRIITSRPSTMFCELQGSIRLLCGSLKHSSSNVNSSDQCKGGHEASHGGEHDHLEPIVEASNELQETVRLCDIRSTMSEGTSYLDTIIVLEEMLVNTNSFLSLMSQASRSGFLSADPSAALKKSILKTDHHTSSGEEQFLELPWLQCRAYSSTISMTDLLVNRLEIALWTSYWSTMRQHEEKRQQEFSLFPSPALFTTSSMVKERGNGCETEAKVSSLSFMGTVKGVITGHPSQPPASALPQNFTFALAATTTEATAPILDILQTRTALVRFWSSKSTEEKLEFVKNFEPAIDEIKEERGKSNGRTVEKLLLPPLSWVAKDCGQGVHVALNRVNTAYAADCVMEELLALELGKHVCASSLLRESSSNNSDQHKVHYLKNRPKKLKKKKNHNRPPKGPQKQQQSGAPCSRGRISPMSSSEMEDSPTTLPLTDKLGESDNGCCHVNTKNVNVPKGVVAAYALLATPETSIITVDNTQDSSTDGRVPACERSCRSVCGVNGSGANSENLAPVPDGNASPTDASGDCGWKEVVGRSRRKKEKSWVQNERHHHIELGKDGGRRRCNRQLAQKYSGGWSKGSKKGGIYTMKLKHTTTTTSNSGSMMLHVLNSEGAAVSNPLTPDCGMNGQEQRESNKCHSLEPSIDSATPPPSQSFIEASSHISSTSCYRRMEAVSDSHSAIVSTSVAQQDRTLVMETGSTVSTDPTQPPSPSSVSSAMSTTSLGISEHPLPPQSAVNSQYGGYRRDNKMSSFSFAYVVKAQSREDDDRCNSNVHCKEGEEVQLKFKMDASPAEEVRRIRKIIGDPDPIHYGSSFHPPSIRDCIFSGGMIEEESSRNDGIVTRKLQNDLPAQSLDPKRIINRSTDDADDVVHNNKGLHHDNDNSHDFDSVVFGSSLPSSAAADSITVSRKVEDPNYKPRNLATAPENKYTTSSIAKQSVNDHEDGEEERCNGGLTGTEQRIGGGRSSTYLLPLVEQLNELDVQLPLNETSFSAPIENHESVMDALMVDDGGDLKREELSQSAVLSENHNVDNDIYYQPPPGHEGSRGDVGSTMVPKQHQNEENPHGQQKQHSSTCKMQVKDEPEGNKNDMEKSTRSVSQQQQQQQQPSTKKSMTSVGGGEGLYTIDEVVTTKNENTSNSSSNDASLVDMQGVGRAQQNHTAANPSAWLWMGGGIVPWMAYPDYSVYDEAMLVKHLDANIEAFMRKLFSVMCPKRRAWRRIVEYLTKIVINTWEEARVEVYGSCYTGLELPSSDVDVVVCSIGGKEYEYGNTPKDPYNSEETVGHLRQLAIALECEPWVLGMKVIETASIPVIKILADPTSMTDSGVKCTGNPMDGGTRSYFSQDPSSIPSATIDPSGSAVTGGNCPPCAPCTVCTPQEAWPWVSSTGTEYVPLDISFSSPMHGGIRSSKWVRENVQEGKYRCCVPTTLIIKEMLCQRGLNQPWSGGLSSYSLINMMITVLQEIEKQRVRDSKLEMFANSLKESNSDTISDGGGGGTSLPVAAQQQPTCENRSHSQPNGLTGEDGLVRVSMPVPTATGESSTNLDCVVGLTERELMEESLADISPGLCLLRFLEFYRRAFNNRMYGISVGRGVLRNPFILENSVADQQSGFCTSAPGIVIEDPINMSINVAHSCFGFPQVQWLFSNFLSALQLRGPEIIGYDKNADLLQLLGYF